MTFIAQLSPRHTLFALALSLTLATPALADPWRGGPAWERISPIANIAMIFAKACAVTCEMAMPAPT